MPGSPDSHRSRLLRLPETLLAVAGLVAAATACVAFAGCQFVIPTQAWLSTSKDGPPVESAVQGSELWCVVRTALAADVADFLETGRQPKESYTFDKKAAAEYLASARQVPVRLLLALYHATSQEPADCVAVEQSLTLQPLREDPRSCFLVSFPVTRLGKLPPGDYLGVLRLWDASERFKLGGEERRRWSEGLTAAETAWRSERRPLGRALSLGQKSLQPGHLEGGEPTDARELLRRASAPVLRAPCFGLGIDLFGPRPAAPCGSTDAGSLDGLRQLPDQGKQAVLRLLLSTLAVRIVARASRSAVPARGARSVGSSPAAPSLLDRK